MNLLDALSGLGTVLDTPGAMLRTGLAGENPLDAVFDTEKRVSGRELLEKYGLAGANEDQGWVPDLGDLGGFAAEMVLDPTNLIGGGLLAKLLGTAGKAKAANRAIEAANTLSKEQRAMGFMPEEVAKLTKIVDETGAPKRVYHGTARVWEGPPDASKWNDKSLYGPGHYTTDAPTIASEYVGKGEADLVNDVLLSDQRLPDLHNRRRIARQHAQRAGQLHDDVKHERAWRISDRLDEQIADRHDQIRNDALAPAVKMNYIDARNPFQEARTYPVMDLSDKAPGTILDKFAKGQLERVADAIDEGDDLFANTLLSVKGSELLDALGNHSAPALKAAGYDAINHAGGRQTGGMAHNVTIALDPSQVYLPYIAKELQELQRVANPNSLLALLGGKNLLQQQHE